METTGINGLIDWLANIRLWQVVVIAAILFAIRMFLKPYKSRQAKSALETVDSALIAVVLVFLVIRPFLVQTFFIPSGSMLPTLELGDRLLVSKIDYRFSHPKRGDIIVFKAPPEASPVQADFIKRLVGEPGDIIQVTAGYVQLHGYPNTHTDLKLTLFDDPSPENNTVKLERNGVIVNGRVYSPDGFARLLGEKNASGMKIVPGKTIQNGKVMNDPYTREDPDYSYLPFKVPKGMYFVMGDNRNNSHDSHAWGPLDQNRVIGKAMLRFWPPMRIGLVR